MSLENGPPCVHWRLERERETNSRRKKKKEATLSQIMEEGLCYSRSRGCKSFAIYGILSEKRLDKRPIKSLPAKSRPKSSTNPFPPPPSGLFSSSMNRGGISNNARWKPTLPRPAVFIRVGVARCGSLH